MPAALKRMTAEEFLLWCLDQEGRWELVDGVPVEMMAGTSGMHDDVVVNLIVSLREKLRGGPCRPKTADTAVRTSITQLRRPDVTVECAPSAHDRYEAMNPVAVFEVLSPSTRTFDEVKKPLEYQRIASLRHIVLIDLAAPQAVIFSRGDETSPWTNAILEGLQARLELTALGCEMPLAEVYDGIDFTPA